MQSKREKMKKVQALAEENRLVNYATDPLGMYTGNPEEPYEVPVQDADDL